MSILPQNLSCKYFKLNIFNYFVEQDPWLLWLFVVFVFVFSIFYFSLWLSYVFADGELKFNYFVVKVKSCFQDKVYFYKLSREV